MRRSRPSLYRFRLGLTVTCKHLYIYVILSILVSTFIAQSVQVMEGAAQRMWYAIVSLLLQYLVPVAYFEELTD